LLRRLDFENVFRAKTQYLADAPLLAHHRLRCARKGPGNYSGIPYSSARIGHGPKQFNDSGPASKAEFVSVATL
jgi:hypothetical protein